MKRSRAETARRAREEKNKSSEKLQAKLEKETNNMKSGKLYIYNPKQAQFYIKHGVRCIDTQIHKKTRKIFWVFNWEEAQPAFTAWVDSMNKR